MMSEYLDEDGYPTEEALAKIASWNYEDPKGWFAFVKEIWYLRSWGWTETDELNSFKRPVRMYHISTAGWSGNESIISAMRDNAMMWDYHWLSSKRGGHYKFDVEEESDDQVDVGGTVSDAGRRHAHEELPRVQDGE